MMAALAVVINLEQFCRISLRANREFWIEPIMRMSNEIRANYSSSGMRFIRLRPEVRVETIET